MDAQILQELVAIRWIVIAVVIAVGIFAIAYIFSLVVNYSQALENVKTGDFFARGNALLMKGKLNELLDLTERHLADFPADAGAHWLKGTAHYRRKEWHQALVSYRKADELQPGFAVGPPISEIEEKIANAGTAPDLKVVAPVTSIHGSASTNEGPAKGVDA